MANKKGFNARGVSMTAQEAACRILNEAQRPLPSREIAEIALNKGYVSSSAKDPVFSIASTIEKNIRDDLYNSPRLVFIKTEYGRRRHKIGLPSMEIECPSMKEAGKTASATDPNQNFRAKKKISVRVELPEELIERLHLASQAKLVANFDETVALLLQKGLSVAREEVQERVLRQLEQL